MEKNGHFPFSLCLVSLKCPLVVIDVQPLHLSQVVAKMFSDIYF